MQFKLLMASGLVLALGACGKPAEVQPEPQIAGETAALPPADPADTTLGAELAPPAADADGFPVVPSAEEIAAAAAAADMPVTPEDRLKLVCDNDEKLVVRFFPEQGIAVLVRADQNIELNKEPADSGVRYSNGTTTLTGEGNDYTVQIGMMTPMQCVAA